MSLRSSKPLLISLWVSCAVFFINSSATAQDDSNPKYDIFLGYQWVHPGITLTTPGLTATTPLKQKLPDMPQGGGGSVTYNFRRYLGLEGDFGVSVGSNNTITTVSAGPRIMFRMQDAALFLHGMVGLNRLNANGLPASNRAGGILGGGFDLNLFRSVSWRVFEADWMPTWHHYVQSGNLPAQTPFLNAVRLRTGVVFNLGGGEAQPVSATADVQPSEAMVGEPLTANATANNFSPKHRLTYDWSSTCGKITGNGTTASIDTHNTPGGNCTASVKVTDPKVKKNNVATASSNFTVKEPPKNPPTMACTAAPASVQAGARVIVSCSCSSPDNVPVTVSNYSATAGSITGSGNTVALNTSGVNPGKITVNATCSDQRGLNTPSTTEVAIENPPPPPPPQVSPEVKALEARLALHSIYFPTAEPTKAHPSGGLVRSQQATLTALAADFKKYLESKPDAKLTLEGHADVRGAADYNQALSERRVDRTKSFLIEQGVPAANIETKAFGAQQQLTADQVKSSVDQNPELTPGEKARILKNERTIILASNRRVDVTLSTTGQESVRQFPFNAADSLTLIGGREKPAAGKKVPANKSAPMKKKP